MVTLGPTTPGDLPAPVTRWSDLVARARAALVTGLGEGDPGSALVLIRPKSWLPAAFNKLAQRLELPVVDEAGNRIALMIPHGPDSRSALADLESLVPSDPMSVFGRLVLQSGSLALSPVAVIDAQGGRSLGLMTPRERQPATVPSPELRDDQAGEEIAGHDEDDELAPGGTDDAASRALAGGWAEVEAVVAAGIGAYRRWPALDERSAALRRLGLNHAAGALERVRASAGTRALPAVVLDAAWILRLSRATLAVEQAAEHLR
jgi:hypothetical protein